MEACTHSMLWSPGRQSSCEDMKGPFVSDTEEESTLHVHCSGSQGDNKSVTLGKPLHVHCSGLLGDRASSQYDSFT